MGGIWGCYRPLVGIFGRILSMFIWIFVMRKTEENENTILKKCFCNKGPPFVKFWILQEKNRYFLKISLFWTYAVQKSHTGPFLNVQGAHWAKIAKKGL